MSSGATNAPNTPNPSSDKIVRKAGGSNTALYAVVAVVVVIVVVLGPVMDWDGSARAARAAARGRAVAHRRPPPP